MSLFVPTSQQEEIQATFDTGDDFLIRALAGTGKTSTFLMLAKSRPDMKMTYVAFNRAIADEAELKFPKNVVCKTMHSFAYAVMGRRFAHRMNAGRVPAWKTAQILRIPERFEYGDFSLRSFQLVSLVNEAVKRFCSSDIDEPTGRFIPKVPGLETSAARQALVDMLLPYVLTAWEDLTSDNGQLRFDHYVYLKLWGMGDPVLPGKVFFYDEAQDATPLARRIVAMQDGQLGVCGDSYQQLYQWMGAIDSLDHFEIPEENQLSLTKSFRFGHAIADEANTVLALLGSPLRLEGHEPVPSQLAYLDDPETVLCRTNAEAVARLLEAQAGGVRAGLVGGTEAVESLAQAALDLSRGRKTTHPELIAFESWSQVCEYVDSDAADAADLRVLVKLVNRHGPETILDAVKQSVPAAYAHLKISTGHKAKGLEWDRVRLAGDFPPPFDPETGEFRKDEARLAYVCITRAKLFLDSSHLGENYSDMDRDWDWLSAAAAAEGRVREFLPAFYVPEREVVDVTETTRYQLECDPSDATKLVFRDTKYNPQLIEKQRELPRRKYWAEYNGDMKVNTVLATLAALQVAESFGLSIDPAARERVQSLIPQGSSVSR